MRNQLPKLLALTLLLFIGSNILQAQEQEKTFVGSPKHVIDELIVQVTNSSDIRKLEAKFSESYNLKFKKELSKPAGIWLVNFDYNQISHDELIVKLYAERNVKAAQKNHKVEMRSVTPNDPDFDQQWHHVNTGQTGGTPDADIDSDLAWEVTTGGQTIFGDDIVVCIIESADLSHSDLDGNRWVNVYESSTPNGQDDDGNGYVDDYFGWNIQSQDDNIGTGGHGTQVAGMIGAVGDNDHGVAGANWDVKLMVVAGHNTQESAVIEAYSYPLTMRQLYNDTDGEQGAFVVATNASWGIDNGDPDDNPIWCDFYNTLGEAGILNCGATTNSNADVDDVGDVPTACASDYMIGVGRSDHDDDFAGGYGKTTIDLVAPGIDVYTTNTGNSFGATTGTSFSSPLTAGVIGLLYSVPCPELISIAKADPQQGADIVREALLTGVDQKPHLEDYFITGGRLNANNAVQFLLENYCSASVCITPMNITENQITDTEATISWNDFGFETEWEFNIRLEGETDWETEILSTTAINIDTLSVCTSYEYTVKAICNDEESDVSDIQVFTTDGCCAPPETADMNIITISTTVAAIGWDDLLAANAYNIRYRDINETVWIEEAGLQDSQFSISNLDPCTEYEIQVQVECDGDTPDYSDSFQFTTTGCDVCTELDYCDSYGPTENEVEIISVALNGYTNNSGNDDGYGDYTGTVATTMVAGEEYEITVEASTSGFFNEEFLTVWIDFNQDGNFSADELVISSGINATMTETFTVPETAITGVTRMRVTVKSDFLFIGAPAGSCEALGSGEVEDYCVEIEPQCDFTVVEHITDASCEGVDNGSIELEVFNGEEPLTYNWNTGAETALIENLAADTYEVTVTDDTGCSTSHTFEIETDYELLVSFESTRPTCMGDEDGSITAIGYIGAEPYTFDWENGPQNNNFYENIGAGNYTVVLTDADGCMTTAVGAVQEGTNIKLDFEVIEPTCFGDEDGSITVVASQGEDPYEYAWENGPETETYSGLSAGEYTVTVTDFNNCSTTDNGTIGEGSIITASFISTSPSCIGDEDGTITADGEGGEAPYTYDWTGGPEAQTYTDVSAGDYTVTVTDANGCEGAVNGTVTDPDADVADFTIDQDGPTVTFNNNSTPGDYVWDFDDQTTSTEINPTHTYTENGLYEVCLMVMTDCGSTTHCDEVEVTTVGINQHLAGQIKVYPNPASSQVFFEINTKEAAMIQLYDISGRIVMTQAVTSTISDIDVNALSNGTYIYHIRNNDGASIYVDKININR